MALTFQNIVSLFNGSEAEDFQIDNNLMPPVGIEPLTECEKLQFKNWVDNGLVE